MLKRYKMSLNCFKFIKENVSSETKKAYYYNVKDNIWDNTSLGFVNDGNWYCWFI